LARIAAEATDMLIAPSVLLSPLSNPIELAEQLATLDIICKGKTALGLGMGWRPIEFQALGVPWEERLSRFVEGLEIMKRLWTEDNVTFETKHYRLSGVTLTLRPAQKPYPPIWIGATAERAVRRAARIGDAWVAAAHSPLSSVERLMQTYRQALKEANKPFPQELPARRQVYVAATRKKALDEATPFLKASYNAYARWGLVSEALKDKEANLSFEAWMTDSVIIGSPDDCIEQLKDFHRRLGVNHILLAVHRYGMEQAKVLEAIRLLGREVIPALRPLK